MTALMTNHNGNDRVLKLSKMEGKSSLSNSGAVDNTLLTGGNKLHVIRDEQTALWHFKFERGQIPQSLSAQWTTFQKAFDLAKAYYARRNINVEMSDA